ncbi:hypothetical protein CK477_22865 [Enterobacter cloacae]|uniref:hypothetical protein n=1 Tax=Enterobacter quasihormaechei TaxID=2529382 RepID=UPI000C9A0C65|nr:hypothetical protein CK477_22865 [Enterobacter cloacae]
MAQCILLPQSTMMQKVMMTTFLSVMLSDRTTIPVKTKECEEFYVDHAFHAIGQNNRVRFLNMHYPALNESVFL